MDVLWERMQRDPATGEQRPALTDLDGRAEMAAVAEDRAAGQFSPPVATSPSESEAEGSGELRVLLVQRPCAF